MEKRQLEVSPFKRYLKATILFVILIGIIGFLFTSSDEFVLAIKELDQISVWKVLLVLFMMLIFFFLDAYLMHYPIPQNTLLFSESFRINLAGCFFSSITPYNAASHPSRLYYLHRHHVPLEHAMTGLLVKGFTYQIVLVVLGLLALLFTNHLVVGLPNYTFVLWVGFLYNIGLTVMTYFLANSKRFSQFLIRVIQRLANKKHFKRLKKNEEKIVHSIEEFYTQMSVYLKTMHKFLWVLFVTLLKVLLFYAIPLVILDGFGFDIKGHILELMGLSALTSIVIATVPLPGGVGAAIGVFVVLFGLVYNGSTETNTLVISMVVWRFFTYYLQVFAGFVSAVLLQIRTNKIEKVKI